MAIDDATDGPIYDLEKAGSGIIERFNVTRLGKTVGAYKHITAVISEVPKTGVLLPETETYNIELRISGMLPLDALGAVVGENNIYAQAEQVIQNIAVAIQGAAKHYGQNISDQSALSKILDTTVFLSDMAHFAEVNRAYTAKGMPFGCRAAVAVRELPLQSKGVLVEIRANALLEYVALEK